VVYSAYDALHLAEKDKHRDVVFLGVGFETTAPTVGAVIQRAKASRVSNFTVLSMHKVIPPALEALVQTPEVEIDGFLCPGHVSTIIGTKPYKMIAENYHIPCVIAGFEPVDILQAIGLLVRQIEREEAKVEIQYKRAVTEEGNPRARAVLDEVFETCDSAWRGFGVLPRSGLRIAPSYGEFDSEGRFAINPVRGQEPEGCLCGRVLQGLNKPPDCPLFGRSCTPDQPIGACMVSSEGTCAAYYRYST
jgi:hydrogenase expression/formation protein HypD